MTIKHFDFCELNKFFDFLRKTINDINKCIVVRKSKLNFTNILYSICCKIGLNYSYEKLRTHLYINGIAKTCNQAICKRRNDIDPKYFKELNDKLNEYINENFNEPRYVLFDGSKINVPLTTGYYQKNEHGTYRTAMIGSLYDSTKHVVINYTVSKSFNEREILIKQLDYLLEGDILIGDRGYSGTEIIWELIDRNFDFVIRLPCHLNAVKDLISTGKDDAIIDYKLTDLVNVKLRIVKYTKGKDIYYIGTTLINNDKYPIDKIKDIYSMRWDVETDFRYSKSNLSLGYLMSQSKNFIEQDVYVHQFIGIIECIIRLTCFDSEEDTYKMNTNNSYSTIIEHLLKQILCRKKTKKVKLKIKKYIMSIINSKIKIIKNRYSKRVVKRPKQHLMCEYRNEKKNAIKDIDKETLNKLKNKQKNKRKARTKIRIKKYNKIKYKNEQILKNKINNYIINENNHIFIVNFVINVDG